MIGRHTNSLGNALRRGFSLVESTISVFLVGVLAVAALWTAGAGVRRQANIANQVRGKRLAHDLMQEILQQAYQDPIQTPIFGPEPGETTNPPTRSHFNDVDDYVGWTESPPADKSGNVYPGFIGWTRSVNVQWADPVSLQSTAATNTGLKLITVTVSFNGQTQATLVSYRSIAWSDTLPTPSDATANHPPVAVFTGQGGNPFTGSAPFATTFYGTGSSDPDGDALSYVWNFGDGTEGQGSTVTHTYSNAGTYTATLTVYDGRGGVGTTSQVITVAVHH